jgi:hypothetical protein
MKYVKFLVALLAACMLVMPAFSMPNFGDNAKDGKALIDAPCQSPAAPEDPHGPQPCDCKDKKAPRSMMGGKCDKPMMGPEGDKFAPKSMMSEKAPCEQAPKMDEPMMDEKAPCGHAPKSMMDGKFAPQEDGKFAPKDDGKFAPQEDGKFAPQEDGKFAPKDDGKFAPQEDGKFAPQDGCKCAKSMMDGKFAPQEDGKFAPQDDGKSAPLEDGNFAPQNGGKCTPKSMMPERAPCQKHFEGQDDKQVPEQDCTCQGH